MSHLCSCLAHHRALEPPFRTQYSAPEVGLAICRGGRGLQNVEMQAAVRGMIAGKGARTGTMLDHHDQFTRN